MRKSALSAYKSTALAVETSVAEGPVTADCETGAPQKEPIVAFAALYFDLGRGAHDFASHKLALALASGAPSKAEDKLLADVVGVCATFPLKHKWKQEGKDACLIVEPITIKPNGEAIGPYRWAVVYNATAASGPLVCYFDCWLDELGRPTQERGLLTMVAGGALALKFGRILAF